MTDEEIIDLYWKREQAAIQKTSEKYGRYCQRIAWNILANHEDTEECLNDTWFKIWGLIPPGRPSIFSTFIGKISRNLAIDKARKNMALKRGCGEINGVFEELKESVSGGIMPEKELEAKELAGKISWYLRKCKRTNREIFIRRYWYMDSIHEIGKIYGYSDSKVKSILHRMRKGLKNMLEKEGFAL